MIDIRTTIITIIYQLDRFMGSLTSPLQQLRTTVLHCDAPSVNTCTVGGAIQMTVYSLQFYSFHVSYCYFDTK